MTVDGRPAGVTFTSPNTISLHEPLPKASDVVIARRTKADGRLVEFSDNAELTADDLDTSALQQFYLVQEAYDITTDAVVRDAGGNWDAMGGRIVSVGDAVDPMDALNLRSFEKLTTEFGNTMWEYVNEARGYAEQAEAEVAKAAGEVAKAQKIQEAVQDLHDATDEIRNDARLALTETVNERQKAEQAVVTSREWAEKSAYWYEVFRTIYHGSRADHPTGDVATGAIYFNLTDNRIYFFNGSQWLSPTNEADRAESARRAVESMRNEVSNMRDQVQVYSGQTQELVGEAQDAANAAARHEGAARNEATVAQNQAIASAAAATLAGERATAADTSAKAADAAAGRAEAAAAQVGETFGDRGGWYVAHGMPTKPMRSSLWTVMDGGELNGVEWNVGDMLVYSIKTNSFGRITGASITPSEPGPIEAEEGVVLGDGKFVRARVGANIRWLAHANSEGVKLGDNAVELHLLGNNMVFGALKHPVFHKGNLPSWDDVTGKPASFPASKHSHKWDEITGKPAAALRWPTWFEVTDKPTYFPPATHGHSWNEITNKPDTALRWPTLAEVGAAPAGFGLGTEGKSLADKSCNDAMESGFYSIYSSTTDTPYGSGPSGSGMMVVRWGGGAGCFQLFFAYTAARIHARRRYQDQWLDWFELYSTSKKPTAADVGALPANGGNLTGKVQFVGVPDAGGLGRYALDMNNHNIGGLNALVFNDPAEAGGEGIFFPKTGKADGSTSMADYDVFTALDGKMTFNGKKVYHEDSKPTLDELGAFPVAGGRASGTIEALGSLRAMPSGAGNVTIGGNSNGYAEVVGRCVGQTDWQWNYGLRFYDDNTWRVGANKIYHQGFKPTAADVKARPDNWVPSWGDVMGKPSTFPAAAHGHAWADITGKPSTFPPATHSHAWGDITGKPATYPAAAHKHSWSELTGIPVYATRWPTASEVGAAASSHGHARQFGSEQTLSTEDLDTLKTPGVYAQHSDANTSAERHYPENRSGSLIVTTGAGVQQRYHVYNTSRIYTRAQYHTGGWTPWALEYNTQNKPTAADVGAIALSVLHALFPVGHVVISLNGANPATYGYPGAWERIADETFLISASTGIGGIVGTNYPGVPLPAHGHAFSATTSGAGAHAHTLARPQGDQWWQNGGQPSSWWGQVNNVAETTSAVGDHVHTVSGSTSVEGTGGATLDVRGQRMHVFMWRRVA